MRSRSKHHLSKFLEKEAKKIKRDILKIHHQAYVGHIGSALSIADILTVLYHHILKINPKNPLDPLRDRFILSKGHAASVLYAALYRRGFFPREKLLSFCQDGGAFGEHPEYNPALGIELSTGSLGHGLSVGVGLALGIRESKRKSSPRVFVLLSDAELNEGSTWEAVMFAAHHKLDNLIAIIDDNGLQAFGRTEKIIKLQPLKDKWEAFGWEAEVVNGHDVKILAKVLNKVPLTKKRPSVIIAKTVLGKGVNFMENKLKWHYFPIDQKLYQKALKNIENG